MLQEGQGRRLLHPAALWGCKPWALLCVHSPARPSNNPPTLPQPPITLCPQNNLAQRDTGTAMAVGEALLGALCVYRGFEDKLD